MDGSLSWLFGSHIGLRLSFNIAHGPPQGLPDVVPEHQIGTASRSLYVPPLVPPAKMLNRYSWVNTKKMITGIS